ncbi:unnamed protein product [Coffea canephora]|uniref:AAA+ ATPase domain-containing protein n=1 Tax=Coffea canephora TaxID=49390 RepID=A0A068V9R5_COFCA|nr:unnamed protein product [Coffea canephora]
MADAAVSATIRVALQTVVSLAADHVNLAREFPKELERLEKSAAMIRGFLAGADKDMRRPGVQNWLEQLEDEVFKADNVLDELNYKNLRRKVKYQNQPLKKKVLFCFSFFNKIGFRWSLGSTIREINTNLERIHGHARGLGLECKGQVEETSGAATSRQTDSKIVRSDVLGRDEDESKIVKKLLTESESDRISVISITGPPGLGKTTLAKAVIVEGIETELKEKRYLLVLDDLWNHQEGLLNDCFTTLEALKPKKGSWCLVTSRLQEVAIVLSRHRRINFTCHDLGKLYDDDCWSIVKNWATVGEEVPKELEDTREQVLRRCDGLPLAATLIGGLLSKKRKEDWLSILEESLLNGDQGGIEQILKVSFDHLSPAPVKKCFAYCSIFDQDTKLEQDLLVEHWMAEGFLQPDTQNERMMEQIGYEYLRILLQTSLLEEVKEERRTWYKMHDLVHDFAKSILNRSSSNQDRHLAVYSSERTNEKASASLRTLFLEGGMADDMLSKFKYLHVLKLFGADVKELPTSIGKLIHLHLLDISGSWITILPKSLCKLYCLQTLRIGKLEEGFPKKMSNLISMRHFHYDDDAGRKIQMPSSIGRWTCLQTLEFFNIGHQEEGRGIQELGTLQDLKGSLEIRNLELVNGKDNAKLANLSKKPNMHRLVLEWGNRDPESDKCDEDVLEGLQPHPNLKELHIRKFRGNHIPQWLVKSSTLVELHLINCRELPVPTLSSLQHLYGSGTTSIQTFFPALKILSLECMKNLEEWKDANVMDVFPVLEKLYIRDCPQLTTIPTPMIRPENSLSIDGRDSLSTDMLERLCLFPSLQSVELWFCSNITTLRGMSCAACLKRLVVIDCENLWELPEDLYQFQALDLLKSLEKLTIGDCKGLTRFPVEMFESCTSLRELQLLNCPNLVSFPLDLRRTPSLEVFSLKSCPNLITEMPSGFGYLTSLRGLLIGPILDYSVMEFDWAGLASSSTLRYVSLWGMPDTKSLPHQLQNLTTITSLRLQNFGAIEALPDWLGNLASLEELFLFSCQKLEYLPSIAAMERLKLRSLEIYYCPLFS